MSKENTQKFLDQVGGNASLKAKLLDSPASAWVDSAKSSGLDITVGELADELIGYIRRTSSGELNEGSLDAVTGGAGVPQVKQAQLNPNMVSPNMVAPNMINPNIRKGAARW
jgi:hypothetical protein